LITNWGRGSAIYDWLKREDSSNVHVSWPGTIGGNRSYVKLIKHLRHAKILDPYIKYRATMAIHGETDSESATYQTDIETWQTDIQADVDEIYGTSNLVPMFHSQMQATVNCSSGPRMLLATYANPTKHVVVCPKYFLTYVDNVHLNMVDYAILGEYYAKAYKQHIIEGTQYYPLCPKNGQVTSHTWAGLNSNVIRIPVQGVVGDLVLDDTSVTNPVDGSGLYNYGFRVRHANATIDLTVQSVLFDQDNKEILLFCSGAPVAGQLVAVDYARTFGTINSPLTLHPRGNVRDSDPAKSVYDGRRLYNWLCTFQETFTP
jgi:hypothetical protein